MQGEDKPPKCWEELEQAVNVAMYDADDEARYGQVKCIAWEALHAVRDHAALYASLDSLTSGTFG